jgi:PPOX class probable F420-dependent enzyme
MAALTPFDRSWTVLLTTYRRDGTPVGTPVNLAVEGDRAYVRSYDKAWKTRRIAHNPDVEIAPSSVRGRPRGPALRARARLLEGEEAQHARRVIARRHPVFQGFVVPLAHKLARYTTMHYELSVVGDAHAGPE